MAKRRRRIHKPTIEISARGIREITADLSDNSRHALIDKLADETGEESRVAEAVIQAHLKHHGPCQYCDEALELVRLPDKTRPDEIDAQGISIRLGLLRCKCGEQGFILNPDQGFKP